ncbi:hypothetical protein JCM19037_1426 [Geomicrobium sp. JCM 19037]|uniref:hypothetical protein n=1 Tax=Geomicrobium sp. JCM 19037 TaxID=1460634 RepID=UPI00045F424E|nr:hypothetical protein [Geomicrobium sp. JCM 19037]GAK03132.1 hypothetical protein JCM19037_1426 [Geomicrobium sp. JCM 19037]
MTEKDWREGFTEVKESLAEIRTDQKHLLQYIKNNQDLTSQTMTKADEASNTANQALYIAQGAKTDLVLYKEEQDQKMMRQKKSRRYLLTTIFTIIGLLLTLIATIAPILFRFYGN